MEVNFKGTRSGRTSFSVRRFALKTCNRALMLLAASVLTTCTARQEEVPSSPVSLDLGRAVIVDLTHPFDTKTLYWPTSPTTFELESLSFGVTEGDYFYSANRFCTPEHGGTHLDAPIHFAEGKNTVEQIEVHRLVRPAAVVDVREEAASDPLYRLTPEALERDEARHGRISDGSIVLLLTGWSKHWPDARLYLGDDTPGDASRLSFPSFGEEAARILVEKRQVAALGVDTASIDYGPSQDFRVHRIAAEGNVPGLENLTNLDRLPARGAWIAALPMKISGGSGAPLRVVAFVPSAP